MKAREIFGVSVRLIGLVFLYQGLSSVPTSVASICPVFPHFYWRNVLPSLFLTGWPVLVAYWMVRGAPWLMRLAYPEESNENPPPAHTPGGSGAA